MITIALPFPPSTNHYWRSIPLGKFVKVTISKEGREYADAVARLVAAQNIRTIEGQLFARYDLYPPDNRRRDLDNFDSKAVNDALVKAGVLEDDSQIRGKVSWFHEVQPERKGLIVVQLARLDLVREIYETAAIL